MSTIITKIAGWFGLVHEDNHESATETASDLTGVSPGKKSKAPKYGQFQPVVEALQLALEQFAVGELQGHRAINPNLRCRVTLIEIRPLSEDAATPLRVLLNVHKPDAIAGFIQREILANLPNGRHYDFSMFDGLAPLPFQDSNEQLVDDDPLLAEFGHTNSRAGDYDIGIQWDAVDIQVAKAPVSAEPAQEKNPPPLSDDIWFVSDGVTITKQSISPKSPSEAISIGKAENSDILIKGTYVSALHGSLWFDQGQWWYQDKDSTNGSCVRRPRVADVLFPKRGEATSSKHGPLAIPTGSRIYLSAIVEDATPFIELPASVSSPEKNAGKIGTPLQPLPPPSSPDVTALALLSIGNVDDRAKQSLIVTTLPFLVGRSSKADWVIPSQHAGLSSEHLKITAIRSDGAHIRILGKTGVLLEDISITQGNETLWPWGKTMRFGTRDDLPPLLVTLHLPAEAEK